MIRIFTLNIKHQKGRRVPINLQNSVNTEIQSLPIEGHID